MRNLVFIGLFLGAFISGNAQNSYSLSDSKKAQQKLNEEYTNPETSILSEEQLKDFEGLAFFPLDSAYIVKAEFVRTPNEKAFEMPTTTERRPVYVKYGEAHFELKEKRWVLNLYQNIELSQEEDFEDYLFIPFRDDTSGNESYGGGRYLDIRIPENDTLILDFNAAYNPYCAYSPKYSCPIPPEENDLTTRVEAGVKAFHHDILDTEE